MKFVFVVIFLTCSDGGFTQNKVIDSLKKALQTQKEDSDKAKTLNMLGRSYRLENNYTEAFKNFIAASEIEENLEDRSGFATSLIGVARIFQGQGNYFEALTYFYKALNTYEKLKDKKGIADCFLNIGQTYEFQENYHEALENYHKALRFYKELADKKSTAWAFLSIGLLNFNQGNNSEALKNHLSAFQIRKELGDKIGMGQSSVSIGDVYASLNNYSEALRWDLYALNIYQELGDKNLSWGIAMSYESIGDIYQWQGDFSNLNGDKITVERKYSQALDNYFKSFTIWQKIGGKEAISELGTRLGKLYIKLKKFSLAKGYLQRALLMSKETGTKAQIQDIYQSFSTLDSIQGNFKQAYEDYKLFILYRDSLVNEESTKKSLQSKLQYEFDKKQDSTKAEQDKKDAIAVAEIKNQKLIRNFSLGGTLAIVSFGGYSFYRYRRRRKLQSQQEMLNERLRISRELHDDIGSTLGSISIYSEVAKNRSQKNENADEAIFKIGVASRELIEKMSDIVWSINPNNESFEQLKNRMQAFAAMILTPRDIHYDFHVDEENKEIRLTAEERKNIFLIFKEAVYNIVKYAECKNVEVQLSEQNNQLTMIIKDDGKGFETSPSPSPKERENSLGGTGIKNMQARARDINASLDIRSEINEGTAIQFFLTV